MWTSPDHHARRRPFLLARAAALKAVRAWFEARDFIEVETAALQRVPCLETHLHGIPARVSSGDGQSARLYLHTSPEFACKKLLGAGEERIFYLGKVWRDAERSSRHHPEFTMLEWYRKGASYEDLMSDCLGLIRAVAEALGAPLWRWNGREADVFAEWERVSVPEAIRRATGINVLESFEGLKAPSFPPGKRGLGENGEIPKEILHTKNFPSEFLSSLSPTPLPPSQREGGRGAFETEAPSADILRAAARKAGLRVADDDSWGDVFTKIMVARVEPDLGTGRPTLLCDYPAPEAALARRKPDDPRLAERFELYVAGLELANGFSELADPEEQRARFIADQALKQRIYGFSYPLDEDLLEALPRMGAAAGIALGFDRLVMLASGANHIEDVIWSPVETGFR